MPYLVLFRGCNARYIASGYAVCFVSMGVLERLIYCWVMWLYLFVYISCYLNFLLYLCCD